MLRISRNTSHRDVEAALARIGTPEASVMELPQRIATSSGLGVTGALIQLLAAWASRHANPTLFVRGDGNSPALANLAREPHGAAAIYFAKTIQPAQGSSFAATRARRLVAPSLDAMQHWKLRQTMHSRGVHLACFASAANEWVLPLYPNQSPDLLRPASRFPQLVERILGAFEPALLNRLRADQLEAIGNVVYELFANTHDHARTDAGGLPITTGVRGILVRHFAYIPDAEGRGLPGDTPMQKYFAMSISRRPVRTRRGIPRVTEANAASLTSNARGAATPFLELTIYDTGPGLAHRWWSSHMSGTEELNEAKEEEFVRACFALHATTKHIPGSGQGLTSTVEFLRSMRAFMLLRTGRLHLYQDFSRPGTGFAPTRWAVKPPPLAFAPGAVFTIAFPVEG